jgi:hypothetical protein
MGMMPVYYSTTNTKKRKQKRKVGWQKAEQEHKAFLEKWGIDDTKPKKKREFVPLTSEKETYCRETKHYPSAGDGIGVATKKESPKYTGTLIKGIATMHKSNAVPVINKEQATDISNMRR